MNISVLIMYAYTNIEFILTSKMEDEKGNDAMQFNKLIEEL